MGEEKVKLKCTDCGREFETDDPEVTICDWCVQERYERHERVKSNG